MLKRNALSSHEKTLRKLSASSQFEKVTDCMIPTLLSSGKGDNKKISGCQRFGGREMNRWSSEDFLCSENAVYINTCIFNRAISLIHKILLENFLLNLADLTHVFMFTPC